MLITIIGMATGKILVGVSSSSMIGNCLNILHAVIGNCLHILHLSNIEDSDILLYMHNVCVYIYIERDLFTEKTKTPYSRKTTHNMPHNVVWKTHH